MKAQGPLVCEYAMPGPVSDTDLSEGAVTPRSTMLTRIDVDVRKTNAHRENGMKSPFVCTLEVIDALVARRVEACDAVAIHGPIPEFIV